MRNLELFVRESNHIEGIRREPWAREVKAHRAFLDEDYLVITDLQRLVTAITHTHVLRDRRGLNVRVGDHIAPRGGPKVRDALVEILQSRIGGDPYAVHLAYERLHPFTDGNGRSGRALWLWMMMRRGESRLVEAHGFLHEWYYQSLQAAS